MSGPLRVAVIGAGRMGANHLRIYDQLKNAELVGVVDADPERARTAATQWGCTAFSGIEDVVGKVDAVSVCAPSSLHGAIGTYLLDNHIHCLVEKPLAATAAECEAMIAAAERNGAVLMVGHVERFNPAILQLSALLGGRNQVHAVESRRMSWASQRITDVDVVLDLMVHDIDIVLSLTDGKPVRVAANGVRTSGAEGQDYVNAQIAFADGAIANLTASRITQTKVRDLFLTTDLGYITVNYISQELLVYRSGTMVPLRDEAAYTLDMVTERVLVRNAEPLVLELQHFLECAQKGLRPVVGGREALAALEVAWAIQGRIAEGASA